MSISIEILGEVWKYAVVTEEEYQVKHHSTSDDLAMTDSEEKTIDFNGLPKFVTILHEIVHVFQNFLCMQGVESITNDDYDEIYARFFEKYGLQIILTSAKIYKNLHGSETSVYVKDLKELWQL